MAKTFDNKDVSYNKGKSYNLSKKQLKAAGAAKAANKRTVSISSTKRATTGANKGKTLGPAGKPLTGSVKLPSGVTAVYKDGKRVTVSKAKPTTASRPTSSSSGGSRPSTGSGQTQTQRNNANVAVGTIRKGAAGNKYNKWDGKKWVPVSSARTGAGSGQSASVTSTAPAGVSASKWAALSPAQKSTFRQNVTRLANAQGMTMAQAAAKVVAGKGSVLAKAANAAGSPKPKPKSKTQMVNDVIAKATKGK